MPSPNQEIKISPEHQQYLKTLAINASNGEVITWLDIRAAYKKQARIVHSDKGGSDAAFQELQSAVESIERSFNDENHLRSNKQAIIRMLSSKKNELCKLYSEYQADMKACSEEIYASYNELRTTVNEDFDRTNASVDRMRTSLDKYHTTMSEGFDRINTSLDRMNASLDRTNAIFDNTNDFLNWMKSYLNETKASDDEKYTKMGRNLDEIIASLNGKSASLFRINAPVTFITDKNASVEMNGGGLKLFSGSAHLFANSDGDKLRSNVLSYYAENGLRK